MNQRLLCIQREIVELEKPYPKNDLITCYKDFLQVRDFLHLYQFNIKVLTSLIDLTYNTWETEDRISRMSLLIGIKRCLETAGNKPYSSFSRKYPARLSKDSRVKLFKLFRYCLETPGRLSTKQREEAIRISNILIMNLSIDPESEKWLVENIEHSPLIQNRVLRYPAKSKVISNWAREAAVSDTYRSRRAEVTSWLIDEQPSYTIDKQTIIDDFEYLNAVDKKAIKRYETAVATQMLIENALDQVVTDYRFQKSLTRLAEGDLEMITPYPELELTKRFYKVPMYSNSLIPSKIPDFGTLQDTFYKNIDTTLKITMLWAIFYSRLGMSQKARLMKKYYSEETYLSFYKICRRLESVELWRWLKDQQQKSS